MSGLLRIATAGSVDDGKSTLIGRLLLETGSLLEDQIAAVKEASQRRGETEPNLALVTDGLRAEREQNITIDVAYRPFRTATRRFILADSPGHVAYTRNMVTGASTADIVVVLADASRGLTSQSRRHLAIAALLQTPAIVVAVNKMDLVGYDQAVYESIKADLSTLAQTLQAPALTTIPISALHGDQIAIGSPNMAWYEGPSLLEFLDTVELPKQAPPPARLPVQVVLRGPNQSRFYAGTLTGSGLKVGQTLVSSAGLCAKVKTLLARAEPTSTCPPETPVAVQLDDEIDVSRGDWLMPAEAPAPKARTFQATLFWLQPDALRLGMTYQVRQGPRTIPGKVTQIVGLLDLETAHYKSSRSLAMNDIGLVEVELAQEAPLELYKTDRELGSFILVDPHHQTVAAGRIDRLISHPTSHAPEAGTVLWLTGLSGAGKSTLAEALLAKLQATGIQAIHLDGDALRAGLNSDLGFSQEDRLENIRRTAEVARLFAERGFVTICSLISPLVSQREIARSVLRESFAEVFVKCGIDECIRRDPKGLYARAITGTIPNFTGISAPYEPPPSPDLTLDTQTRDLPNCLTDLVAFLESRRSNR